MSIQSELDRITGNIAEAYTKVSAKGGTLPAARNSDNLPDAIDSIPSGGGGGKNIQYTASYRRVTASRVTQVTDTITVAKSGSYQCSWFGFSTYDSGGKASLYVNGVLRGSEKTIPKYNATSAFVVQISADLAEGDEVWLSATKGSSSQNYSVAGLLVLEEV